MTRHLQEKSTAEIARDYIMEHPSILDCLHYDIINFSALARKIMEETGLKNEEAVMMACRRFQIELRSRRTREGDIMSIIKNSRVKLKSKMALINARNEPRTLQALQKLQQNFVTKNNTLLTVQQGSKVLTVILDEELLADALHALGQELVLKTVTRLGEITIESPESIVDTPGVLTRFSASLSEAGINCLEMVSCNTETTFVVDDSQMIRAYDIISQMIR
ncbi:MAG: ACT domain-containing protein [Methanomassiliicoccales archaeon]